MTSPLKILLHYNQPDRLGREIQERFPDIDIHYCERYEDIPKALEEFAPDICFTIRVAGQSGFPREALLNSKTLKWIANGGSGTDHIAPWDPEKIVVTNSAGVAADVMAQYVVGAIFAFNIGFPQLWVDKTSRNWRRDAKVFDIRQKTLLILGLGRVGQSVATLAHAAGLRVISTDINPTPAVPVDLHVSPEEINTVLAEADYVTVCVPLTPQTRGMIDKTFFSAMKSEAVLINVGRGPVVVESDLVEALMSGSIKGAALDVFETEPLPEESPFWSLENVIISPHCCSVFDGWELGTVKMFCDNIERLCAGQPLLNVVHPNLTKAAY